MFKKISTVLLPKGFSGIGSLNFDGNVLVTGFVNSCTINATGTIFVAARHIYQSDFHSEQGKKGVVILRCNVNKSRPLKEMHEACETFSGKMIHQFLKPDKDTPLKYRREITNNAVAIKKAFWKELTTAQYGQERIQLALLGIANKCQKYIISAKL